MPFTVSVLADNHELNSLVATQASNGETSSTANGDAKVLEKPHDKSDAGSVDLTTPGQVGAQTDIIATPINVKGSGAPNIDALNQTRMNIDRGGNNKFSDTHI